MSDADPTPSAGLDAARMVAVDGLVAQISGTVRLAGALAAGGRRVDLDGLDRMIGRLCAQALDLPPELGRRVRPRLAALHGELEALGRRLAPD